MITALLIIAHFFGDFILQSQNLAKKKHDQKGALLNHAIIYTICIALVSFLSMPVYIAAIVTLTISFLHFVTDVLKGYLIRKDPGSDGILMFAADQIIHILTIIVVVIIISGYGFSPAGLLSVLINNFGVDLIRRGVIIGLIYCICLNPTAVFIKKLFQRLLPNNNSGEGNKDDQENIGFVIGILERSIIITLGLAGQIGAIGFILAAKSLARFRQLSKKDFAEKYLVGTLTSALIALACVLIGMQMM